MGDYDAELFPWFADGTIVVDDAGRIWRCRSNGRPCEPRRVEHVDRQGYATVRLPYRGRWRTFKAHRLVWAWAHGGWPSGVVAHRNGCKLDNRPGNLAVVELGEAVRRDYGSGRRRPWSVGVPVGAELERLRARFAAGERAAVLAAEYGLSVRRVSQLAK